MLVLLRAMWHQTGIVRLTVPGWASSTGGMADSHVYLWPKHKEHWRITWRYNEACYVLNNSFVIVFYFVVFVVVDSIVVYVKIKSLYEVSLVVCVRGSHLKSYFHLHLMYAPTKMCKLKKLKYYYYLHRTLLHAMKTFTVWNVNLYKPHIVNRKRNYAAQWITIGIYQYKERNI